MLDSYTSSMCKDSWGRSSFARCLIEVNSEADLVDSVTIGIPSLTGDDFTKETIRVEYEWRPPRCDECKIFGHVHDHCPKKMVNPPIVTTSNVVAPTVEKSNDGFQTVGKKKKRKGKSKSTNGGQFTGPSVKQTVRYEPKATTIAPKKGATNVSNPSKSSSMLKTADTSPKNDNFTTSNSFSALNDEEEDDEEVENVYDESTNLVPNTNTAGSSSFMDAADGFERVGIESAIKRIMMDKEGEEMHERICYLKEKVDCLRWDARNELREELEILLRDGQVSCLITDALWHFTQSVADSLNLPRLVLRTSSLFCFLIYASIPLFDDHGYFELSDNHLEEHQVVEFPMLKVKDILKMGFKGKNDIGGELIGNMVKQTKVSSGIIWNSIKELEEPELGMMLRDFPVPSFLIPFPQHLTASSSSLLEQDRTFFPWLDQQPPNSVLYVSFGSVAQVEEIDFLEIAHGLVDSKQAFVWVVRPGFIKGSDWLDPLPDGFVGERGRIVKWAPQQEVLAHKAIGAFWTHSGWNSTLESVCEGVPMICSPFFGDQPLNARYISEVTKVGVCLENGLHREAIASAIGRVMMDDEIRERAKVLKQKLDVSLIKGGSSYESLDSLAAYISSFHVTHT
ncbi:UDP-glycosyltransferase 76G1-like protein [Tanacetum coccineum]